MTTVLHQHVTCRAPPPLWDAQRTLQCLASVSYLRLAAVVPVHPKKDTLKVPRYCRYYSMYTVQLCNSTKTAAFPLPLPHHTTVYLQYPSSRSLRQITTRRNSLSRFSRCLILLDAGSFNFRLGHYRDWTRQTAHRMGQTTH